VIRYKETAKQIIDAPVITLTSRLKKREKFALGFFIKSHPAVCLSEVRLQVERSLMLILYIYTVCEPDCPRRTH
jgi:hypothetical protein